MTEIRDTSSMKYNNAARANKAKAKPGDEKAKPPKDEVTLGRTKSVGEKIIEFPGKVVKAAAGAALGTVSTPLHILPGAVKGLHEGTTSYRGSGKEWPFHLTMFAQNIALGAGAGLMMGGPLGAVIGGLGGLALTGITTLVGQKTETYPRMIEKTEGKIEAALQDNEGTKTEVAFQNATEGTIIGAGTSAQYGWKVGYESGKGIVSGVVDVAEGVAGGILEVGKNIIKGKKK